MVKILISQKERFGNDRLLAALRGTNFESAQQVIESMKQEVETFRSGAEPNDDLTMMCVCVGLRRRAKETAIFIRRNFHFPAMKQAVCLALHFHHKIAMLHSYKVTKLHDRFYSCHLV